MRAIVCGGRHYKDRAVLEGVLQGAVEAGMTTLVHGGCPTGADSMADAWARERGILVEVHRAQWEQDGLAAGPLRNQLMVEAGADMVIAFPGGKGTNDLVRRADRAGIRVVTVGP